MTQDEARAELRLILKPGQTIYTTLRHVSRSGMMRRISLMALTVGSTDQMGGMHNLDWLIVRAGWGKTRAGKDGLVAGGCGMDMGFALVYNLGQHLWPEGFGCIGTGCPSNDHSNGDRDYTPHSTYVHEDEQLAKLGKPASGKSHWHRSGGYALKHRWL